MIGVGLPGPLDDDVWSVDPRGILTLTVGKDTYEQLGLVGQRLRWKEHQDVHVVHIIIHDIKPKFESKKEKYQLHQYSSKVKALLDAWDERRGPWDVVCCPSSCFPDQGDARVARPAVTHHDMVYIPSPVIQHRPDQESDRAEDWDEDVADLLEWVDMACVGSQRLQGSDNADPYVAVYTPPSSSQVGELVHVRWSGLLSSSFIEKVIEIVRSYPFVALTGHAVETSPVTYLSTKEDFSRVPLRAPRRSSEDSWCVIITNGDNEGDGRWLLAQTIGRWDERFG